MKDAVILRASGDPVRMSYLAALLNGEGLQPTTTGSAPSLTPHPH